MSNNVFFVVWEVYTNTGHATVVGVCERYMNAFNIQQKRIAETVDNPCLNHYIEPCWGN